MNTYKIPCRHETEKLDVSITIPDYHSLTIEEIEHLLYIAKCKKGNVQVVSSIQVRLNQGIVGMTCPRPIDGKVAERMSKLDTLYIEEYEKEFSIDTAERLYKIMTIEN